MIAGEFRRGPIYLAKYPLLTLNTIPPLASATVFSKLFLALSCFVNLDVFSSFLKKAWELFVSELVSIQAHTLSRPFSHLFTVCCCCWCC